MLRWFLPYNNMNQPKVYTCPLPPEPPPPPREVVTEHQAGLSVQYSNFPLAIYFTRGNV